MASNLGYKDLILRWVKSQLGFHGDPVRARRDREEAADIQQTLHDRVQEDAGRAMFNALMPEGVKRKIGELEHHAQASRQAADSKRRAEHEALPRSTVTLTFADDLQGEIKESLPINIGHPSEPGEALTIDISPLAPIAIGNREFRGLMLAIPKFAGAATYDLSALYEELDANWDPYWFQLVLDSDDEPFYWVPDYGPGTITVGPDGQSVRAHLPMQNAGSESLTVDLSFTLPEG